MSHASAASPRPQQVHEIVIDPEGDLSSVRGIGAAEATKRLDGLVEIARRAGQIAGHLELSFFWRGEGGEPSSPRCAAWRTRIGRRCRGSRTPLSRTVSLRASSRSSRC
ncbi:hypothetical protein [Aeromicrobium sp. UC242_57]|uniref:hypothetical protein n=1 Tax=Aeromicrobium sp. UC242_57 TaxID=3374624 RepID=UPI0037A7DB8C